MARAKRVKTKGAHRTRTGRDADGNAVPLQSTVKDGNFSDPAKVLERRGDKARGSMGEERRGRRKRAGR